MNRFSLFSHCLLWLCIIGFNIGEGYARDWKFGLGFNAGVSRLEGDLNGSQLSPMINGHLKVSPWPYVTLSGELGYAVLGANNHPNFTNFRTTLVPLEVSAIFNFLPFGRVNPYLFLGGGGVFWNAKARNPNPNSTLEKGLDSFLKTGGGLEFQVFGNVGLNVGGTFRFSLTDAFDQLRQGDENDQVIGGYAGITYYFNRRSGDLDNDGIPDELDLMPEIAEDKDGYLDHDGIPEKNPELLAMNSFEGPVSNGQSLSPVVVHHLVDKVESGKSLPVKAMVYSDSKLMVVAVLHRQRGVRKWNVVRLSEYQQGQYEGVIPGEFITTTGLEYCVVAVDESLTGVGYAGLPSKPITIAVSKSGTAWRVVGGVVGATSVGAASYLVLRKQKK